MLVAAGCSHFRIEAAYETPAYRSEIARLYRAALECVGVSELVVEDSAWALVRRHTSVGLCNGFYFGRSGSEYVGKEEQPLAAHS